MVIRTEQPQPAPSNQLPLVQVIRANPQTLTLNVRSQGVVTPRTEIDFIPEVTGRVTQLQPAFVMGATFKVGTFRLSLIPGITATQSPRCKPGLHRQYASSPWKTPSPSDLKIRRSTAHEKKVPVTSKTRNIAQA